MLSYSGCEAREGMENATTIPNERITCSPTCNPDDLRPGNSGSTVTAPPSGERPYIDVGLVAPSDEETPILVEDIILTGDIAGFIVRYKRNEQQEEWETYSELGAPKVSFN